VHTTLAIVLCQTIIIQIAGDLCTHRKDQPMKLFFINVFFFTIAFLANAESKDGIQSGDTNLIAFCASNSDVVAHIKLSDMSFVRKLTSSNDLDLSVCGRLLTFDVIKSYYNSEIEKFTSPKIYIYKKGMMSLSLFDPVLCVGKEYLVFLRRVPSPDVVNSQITTTSVLPATNYFSFIRIPQRKSSDRKAYIEINDTNDLMSSEECLQHFIVPDAR
jgi:hypothetical protein